jgi:hypothetical protein
VRSWFDAFYGLPWHETVFAVLVASVGLLALLSLAFAANVLILRMVNDRTARRWARLEKEWEEPVLRVLDDPDSASDLWDRVEERDQLRFVDFLLRWSRRVRGGEEETFQRVALPFLEPFTRALSASRVEERTRAVETLGTLGLPRYETDVLAALDDESPLVAMVAARSLAKARLARHAPPILRHLHRFPDWNRNFLASMLAAMGPAAAPALRTTASDPATPPWVGAVAIEALRHLSDPEAADVAAAIVARTDDREFLAAALRLLTEVGRPEHLDVVRARTTSSDFVIRAHALSALGMLGGRDDVSILQNAVEDPSPWVAIHAARGLQAAGAVEPLRALARSSHPRATLARQILTERDPLSVEGDPS